MSARWWGDPPADDAAARERLIDATESCLTSLGIASITITEVARRAGVSRTTLYKYVGSIDELIEAVFLREVDRFIAELEPQLSALPSPRQQLLELIWRLSSVVPTNAAVSSMLETDLVRGGTMAMAARSVPLAKRIDRLARPYLEEAQRQGDLAMGPLDQHIEWIMRTVLSFAANPQPPGRDATDQRRFVEQFALPGLLETATAGIAT
ncbi:MAG: TetR/AcrR family transcriptional regulator [Acidobacteria bacterium]|nr:TetR/AcrR family transcriptional regulator [Acidobacteriota bacterium]